jgi:hypothetical protein
MPDPNTGGLFDRLGNLVELLTTLDVRVTNALEGLEEMRTSVTGLDPVREDVEQLVSDLRKRLDVLDERLHRDMDDVKAVLMEKLGELDLDRLGPRFDRLEEAIFNIERATINMDHSLEGSVEALPDFLSRRVKDQKRKKKAAEEDQLTHDDLGN